VNVGDNLHLLVGTVLFIGLFSFTLLPPPASQLGSIVQGAATTSYKIVRAVGVVRDENICMLADLWNLGGIEAQLEGGGNVTCAQLTEQKIALTPADERAYGSELGGVVERVWITNELTLNKLFYVSYILFGLVLATIITDVYLVTGMGRYSTAHVVGFLAVAGIGVTMLLFRTGAVWPVLSGLANLLPGNSLLGEALFAFFALTLVWWVVGQIALGYHVTKENYKRFAAVRVAGKADYQRGVRALEAAEKR
jgi:hypothetical protein